MSSSNRQTRVILIRHGRSTFNDQGRYQGSSDKAVLTQVGLETARLVGRYLKTVALKTPIHAVYTSPLKRVQQTVHQILQAMAPSPLPPMIITDDLMELSMAHWEGLTYKQVQQQFAADYECWQQRPHKFELPLTVSNRKPKKTGVAMTQSCYQQSAINTYFPVQNLYQQVKEFWAQRISQYTGKTFVIVSHSGTIHALISTALGAGAKHHHSLQQSNCGISELVFSGDNVQLHQLNKTTTLGETLPKLKVSHTGLRLLLLAADGLNTEDYEQLANRLNTFPLNFCLSASESQQWIRHLLQNQPQTLRLDTQKPDFLNVWQHRLNCFSRPATPLMTGLAIARAPHIEQLLLQTLGTQSQGAKIPLHPRKISVIHYPPKHRPVIQAINI